MADLFTPPAPRVFACATLDTETSDFIYKEKADTADGQGRLASLAIVRTTPTWSITSQESIYVKPEGWKMSPNASAANGLTDEFLHAHGRPVKEALDMFIACIEEGRVIGAFNAAFDIRILRAELKRLGLPSYAEKTFTLCGMIMSIGVCKLRRENGAMKTPKLEEAMRHFRLPQQGAHTATGDALSAMMILKQLAMIGMRLEPKLIPERVWKEPKPPKEKVDAEKVRKTQEGAAPARGKTSWLRDA